jgi:hypothetical protein
MQKANQLNAITRILMVLFVMLLIPQIIWADDYPLTIGNKQVTSANANNVFGDGTVSFTLNASDASGTLTLNNATITGSVEWSGNNLTIKLNGENSITNTSGDAIKAPSTGAETGASYRILTITKTSATAKCKLTLTSSPDINRNDQLLYRPINGFSNISTDLEYLSNNTNTGTEIFTSDLFGGGSGTSGAPYLIKTSQDLMDLSTYVNRGLLDTDGKFFRLEKNINCTDLHDYEPIGYRKYIFNYSLNSLDVAFKGTFDGNNKTISNLKYNPAVIDQQTYDGICLFSYLYGTLKNLTLKGCTFGGGYNNGAITDFLYGTIDNCTISSCTIEGNGTNSGIAGYVDGLSAPTVIKNCSVINCTIQNGGSLGGIAYFATGGVTIQNCAVDGGSITTGEENASIGGIVNNNDGTVTNCTVKGISISGGSNSQIGAIAPYFNNGTFTGNYYYGNVTVKTGGTTLSGHTQRGTGYYDNSQNYIHTDVDGAKLYTKHLTFLSDNYFSIDEVAGAYYEKIGEGVVSVAPGQITKLEITPNGNYTPSAVTVTYTPTGGVPTTSTPTLLSKTRNTYTYSFEMPDADAIFNVTSAINLESNSFSFEIDDKEFSGSAVSINTITMKNNATAPSERDQSLIKGVDYNITGYKNSRKTLLNSAPKDAGSYFAIVEGIGNFTGTVNVPFTITAKSLTSATFSAISDQTYTGSEITPEPTVSLEFVKGEAAKELTKGTDFNFSYSKNINVPTTPNDVPTVTITGKGNFTGTASTTFNIVKATPTVTSPTAKTNLSYSGKAQELVNAGSTTAGTLQYKLGANGTYGTTIPSATDAGSYAVYYKVIGNSNINEVAEAGPVNVSIAKATGNINFAAASVSKTYGDAAFTNALTNTGDGKVTYASNNTAIATVNATTGSVTIVGNGKATITATVADGTNYTYATKTAAYTLNVGTAAMSVTAAGYTGTYDGKAHGITVTAPTGATVRYGTAAGTYNLNDSPTYTNAGTYTVYYQVTKTGFTDVTGSQTVAIAKAAGSISFATASINKTFGDAAFTNALTNTGDGTVTYASNNTAVATVNATTGSVTIVGNGKATITATVADGANYTYATKTASYTLNVGTAAMNVTAAGYTGTYDGKAHGITVTAPTGATVKYGTTAGTYNLNDSPTYTNAGTYTVYYQVTKTGFTDVTGSQTVVIAKAAGSISYVTASIDKLDNDAAFTNVLTKTGDGTVTYTSSDTNVATVNTTTGEVTIVGVGNTTITATVADGTNYTYTTKTATYTLNVAASIKKYDLWIGDTQVTEANMNDVLGDEAFLYVPGVNTLFITNSTGGQRIENRMKEGLKIYLAPSSENKVKDIVSTIPAPLTITTDGNYPGRLELKTANYVIQGFSELNLEENLSILEPDNADYWNQVLSNKEATIGIVIEPMIQEEILELGTPELSDNSLENYVYEGKMLITLKDTQSPEGDGVDDSGTPGIVLNNAVPDEVFDMLNKDEYAPGSQGFASMFTGLTILVPGGEGWILIDAETHDGYCIKLRSIFGEELKAVMTTNGERTTQAFHYEFDEPTFVGIYNGGMLGNAARGKAIRPGRKTVGHIKVYNATVSPGKVNAANPAGQASGGLYTGPVPAVGQDVDNPTVIESGIHDIKTQVTSRQDDKWYNLNGQQIDEPSMKGLYIYNGKKIYIK